MSKKLNKIILKFDQQLYPKDAEMTQAKWKIIAEAFEFIAETIRENGYYPTIYNRESMAQLVERCLLDISREQQ